MLEWFPLYLRPRYISSARQLSTRQKIVDMKQQVMAKAAANDGYLVPSGFELESGILGGTVLHQAFLELIAEGLLERAGYQHGYDRWTSHGCITP